MTDKNIRMVVTDLDGTLLAPNRTISDEAVKTLGQLQDRGILFTFITGRPPYAVKQFAQRVGITTPIVCCNGAVIEHNDVVLSKHPFSLIPLRSLMEDAATKGLTVLLYSDGVEYTLAPTEWTRTRELRGKTFPIWNFADHPNPAAEKVNIMADGDEAAFAALVPEISSWRTAYSLAIYGTSGCEIVSPEVDKATGLKDLCQLCGVRLEETLAIGDNENDHPMLKVAGIGAAVANATTTTKELADYCCAASYTDGVVEAIRKFVLWEDA